jgi:hypothetical protein
MYNAEVEVELEVDDVKAVLSSEEGVKEKVSQEETFGRRQQKIVAVAVVALITELLLVEKDFIAIGSERKVVG